MDTKIRKFGVAILVVVSLVVSAVQVGTVQGQSPVIVARSSNGRIAFVSDRDGNDEIYVMNADGTGVTNLTNNEARDYDPDWSPDGAHIVFASTRGGSHEIYVMNADGSEVTRLADDPIVGGVRGWSPDWSPDGNKIAFTSYRDSNDDIYIMNADGSGVTNLTNYPAADFEPSWSPDGNKIAFTSYRENNYDIYLMNADGTGVIRLTNDTQGDYHPDWSPDGSKIAFESNRDRDHLEVYVMNADGTGQTRLTNDSAYYDGGPDWGPGEVIPTPTPAPTTQPTVQPTPTQTPQPTVTATPQPTSTPSAGDIHLNVQPLRQDDKKEPWAGDIYNLYTPDKVLDTIARWGCATTSAAMVLNYYGKSSGMQTDPKELDDWLAASSGYTPEHGVIWSRVTWFAWDKMGLTLAQPVYTATTLSRLDSALAFENPPIVNVGGHFVVVTGKVGGKYTINDPLTNGHETLDQYQFWGSMIAYASRSTFIC